MQCYDNSYWYHVLCNSCIATMCWGWVGCFVVVLGVGCLFKVHTRALKGNEFSTLLFATIPSAEALISFFSRYPSVLRFVITGSVDVLFEFVK